MSAATTNIYLPQDLLKNRIKCNGDAMGIKCNAMQMRWGTCRHSPWGRRHPRRCWAPRLTSGWPRSASVDEVCPPASPPARPTTWSPSWCRWAWWGCSPWWGQAWRQHSRFCPETFLNLPECDVSNLAKTDSDRGLQQIQPLHLYQSWKLLYVLVEKTLPLCCTADEEEVMGFVGSKPTRSSGLAKRVVPLSQTEFCAFKWEAGKLTRSTLSLAFSAHPSLLQYLPLWYLGDQPICTKHLTGRSRVHFHKFGNFAPLMSIVLSESTRLFFPHLYHI